MLSDRPTDFDSVARRAAEVKTRAARYGRTAKVCLHPYVICRETEREVNEVREYIIRHADQETLEQEFQTYMGPQAITRSHRQTQRVREDFIFLGTFQIFGTPDQVGEKFIRLKHASCDGMHVVFFRLDQRSEVLRRTRAAHTPPSDGRYRVSFNDPQEDPGLRFFQGTDRRRQRAVKAERKAQTDGDELVVTTVREH
jgi:alkanesulfonate monooxygenase SsuD/methylene tetrahydromethanopterin reductase-like flavin-dependent oxidoreductase (luciferase family)